MIAYGIVKKVFEKYGYFDEDIRLIEDYPYWIKLTKHRVLFKYMDKVTVNCKMSGVSSSGNYSEMLAKSRMQNPYSRIDFSKVKIDFQHLNYLSLGNFNKVINKRKKKNESRKIFTKNK